jgi:hypothetical protein
VLVRARLLLIIHRAVTIARLFGQERQSSDSARGGKRRFLYSLENVICTVVFVDVPCDC